MKFYHLIISLFLLIFVSCSTSQKENYFISDEGYRSQVEADYAARNFNTQRRAELDSIMNDDSVEGQHKEALRFLYAYMPLCDVADYSADFFMKHVEYAFMARNSFAWGESIPEDIFRHFVLVHRVNNENMDTARMLFFNELKPRVENLSMYDAALEVNHWCHEKVTYRPSDSRTSSPLATLRTALGRCGEESTFAVTALRAVGIPARQCYTPRWAHTDDNHAWVEVWIEGKWYYLGACEPDAKLNMGWFSIPATRTMMVHSNVYGKYFGSEEVVANDKIFSKLNMLGNYTDTKRLTAVVKDENNRVVADAVVKFKLYNYAEYFPIATVNTDSNGVAQVTTGLGDLLVWASDGLKYQYSKVDVRQQDSVVLVLKRVEGEVYTEMLDIMPPKEGRVSVEVSPEEATANNRRLHYEDSIRNAYVASFPTRDFVSSIKNENLTEDQIWEFIMKSEGNYKEIADFINNCNNQYIYQFMSALADKDLRDTEANTLAQLICEYDANSYPLEVFFKGIQAPRVSSELLRPYHNYLKANLPDNLKSYLDVMQWVKDNITVDNEANYVRCPISAVGVFDVRVADKLSRDIFYVAACRALNIPAYLDNATGDIFAYNEGWHRVEFETEVLSNATGKLVLTYDEVSEISPAYWIHYTLAKYENGDFVTFDFDGDERVAKFPATIDLEPGYYMLSTGSRYSDGTTLSLLKFFNVEEGATVNMPLEMRKLVTRNEYYGTIKGDDYVAKHDKSLLECAKEHNVVLAFIDPNREPTRHLFNDLKGYKTQFEKWGGDMFFVVPSNLITDDFNEAKIAQFLPENASIVIDQNGDWMNKLLKDTDQYFRDNYPLVLIVNEKGDITFKTEGYRIGTGELIFKSLQK